MPVTEKEQINFTLSDEQKQRWEEHIKDSREHESMAQFIRFSVERQIAEDSGGIRSQSAGANDETVAEIADRTRRMENIMGQLRDTMNTVQNSLENPPEEIIELSGEVMEVLPTKALLTRDHKSALDDEVPIVVQGMVQTGLAQDIADHLDVDVYRIRLALTQLTEDTGFVQSTVIDGEERYYRKE